MHNTDYISKRYAHTLYIFIKKTCTSAYNLAHKNIFSCLPPHNHKSNAFTNYAHTRILSTHTHTMHKHTYTHKQSRPSDYFQLTSTPYPIIFIYLLTYHFIYTQHTYAQSRHRHSDLLQYKAFAHTIEEANYQPKHQASPTFFASPFSIRPMHLFTHTHTAHADTSNYIYLMRKYANAHTDELSKLNALHVNAFHDCISYLLFPVLLSCARKHSIRWHNDVFYHNRKCSECTQNTHTCKQTNNRATQG